MKKYILATFFILFIACFFTITKVSAQTLTTYTKPTERINNYYVQIIVNTDSSLDITEEINVTALGDRIKRGIYRDFPTNPSNLYNLIDYTTFDVSEVLKNGIAEPYKIKNNLNTKTLYIGDDNTFLKPGEYTYTIKYHTQNQVTFFKDHDELYFNAIGTDWEFAKDKIQIEVVLPKNISADQIKVSGYTGIKNSTAQRFTYNVENNVVKYVSTVKFNGGDGFTVIVGWPKGIMTKPGILEKILLLFKADKYFVYSFFLFAAITFYYFFVWYLYGKDPKPVDNLKQFEFPTNVSPSLVYYVNKMSFDQKSVGSAILNLAIKKHITISETKAMLGSKFTLTKISKNYENLFGEEKDLMEQLFKDDATIFEINSKNTTRLQSILSRFKNLVTKEGEKNYVKQNLNYLYLPVTISAIYYIVLSFFSDSQGGGAYIVILNFALIFGLVSLIMQTIIPLLFGNKKFKTLLKIFLSIIAALIMFATSLAISFPFSFNIGLINVIVMNTTAALHFVFLYLLKARTPEGVILQSQINQLKKYLTAVENPRYNSKLHDQIPFSINVYEKYLPYAVALGVEPIWTNRLTESLKLLNSSDTLYKPYWYQGYRSFNSSYVTNFNSAFNNSLATFSSSGSSRGSSGFSGGFSGGGGGGGGGGGW